MPFCRVFTDDIESDKEEVVLVGPELKDKYDPLSDSDSVCIPGNLRFTK